MERKPRSEEAERLRRKVEVFIQDELGYAADVGLDTTDEAAKRYAITVDIPVELSEGELEDIKSMAERADFILYLGHTMYHPCYTYTIAIDL